jgi:hypothetical protein
MRLLNLMNISNDMTNLSVLEFGTRPRLTPTKSTCRIKTAELYRDYFDLYMIGLETSQNQLPRRAIFKS